MKRPQLFSPFPLRDVVLKNRVVVSPMWQYAGQHGRPGDWHLMNLGRLADGGSGLVMQEGTSVERRGCGTVGDLGLWSDESLSFYRRMTALVRACGAVPGVQLMHSGRKARQQLPWEGRGPLARTPAIEDWDAWELIAPSPLAHAPGLPVPREMGLADIQQVVEAFAAAAVRADRAGYEVLQIHAAHGYLLHTFLSPLSNHRTDAYGGGFAGRARMLLEVVEAARAVWPAGRPISVRLSCLDGVAGGWSLEDTFALVGLLHARGVDLIDCSSGGMDNSAFTEGLPVAYGYQAGLAAAVRRETGVPTAAVGLIVHAHQAEQLLAGGQADLLCLARELIYNPNWPLDAARKLEAPQGFDVLQRRSALWLHKRAAAVPHLVPSTCPDPFAPVS
jgi:2,4-dienoyl-CoA reductase-like NADH-dependent reductase (Old Yellow Enzyme family)